MILALDWIRLHVLALKGDWERNHLFLIIEGGFT
jgi:hypothetical protein